jgi:hypothetical protein
VRPTYIRTFVAGCCVQYTHMISPLSSMPTGYFFAMKYTIVLFAFVYGDRCTCALTYDRQFFIAISNALRATYVGASSIRRSSCVSCVTRVKVWRSVGIWCNPISHYSWALQLPLCDFHPRFPCGSYVLLIYIHFDLFTAVSCLPGSGVVFFYYVVYCVF